MMSCPNYSGNVLQEEDRFKSTQNSLKKLYIAIGLCTLFMIVELIGGFMANSLAIISDAVHLLSGISKAYMFNNFIRFPRCGWISN